MCASWSARRDEAAPTDAGSSFVCLGLDDMELARDVQHMLFTRFMNCDTRRSGTMGASRREVELFQDVALGTRNLQLAPAAMSQADIVVLDREIYAQDGTLIILGEDLALQLRNRGFVGTVVLFSGSSSEDLERVTKLPHIDLVFDKSDANLPQMGLQIVAARLAQLSGAKPPVFNIPRTTSTGLTMTSQTALTLDACAGLQQQMQQLLMRDADL